MAAWICNRCNEAIVTCDCRRSNDRTYHVECFTCAICDTPIDAAACQIKTNLQEVYCRDCHRRYFQDVSRHSILGGRLDDEDSLSHVGDGVKVVPVQEIIKSSSEPNSGSDHRENADGLEIKAMLHKYSTPVHSIHQIMPPPQLSSVKRALKTKGGTHPPPPVTPKDLMSNPTIEEETPASLNSSTGEPKLNDLTQQTPVAPTPKKKVVRARSRIPVLTPVSSRTQVEEKPPAKTPIVATPRKTKPDASRNTSTPIVTPMSSTTSSAVNDYIKNKARRGFERGTPRPPSRKATPMKAAHSLPRTCQPRFVKPEFPKSMSSMSADTSFSRQSSTGSFVSTPRRTDSQASACTTFVVPRNTPQSTRPSSAKSDRPNASGSYSNIPSHSQLQFMSWNNLHVSPAELPSTQQLLSLMLHPGEKNRPHSEDMSRTSSALSSRSRGGCLDCPICYEGLIDDSVPGEKSKGPAKKLVENVVTECGHIFHRECITNWLVTNGNSKCPICQKLCVTDSLIPVYLDANATIDSKPNENGLSSLVTTLRFDYKDLVDKYNCLLQEHQECGVKCAISDSLKTAYEVECRNRVELQWENKRLQRKIEDFQAKAKVAQRDMPQHS